MFASTPNSQLALHESIAKLLKSKFDLIGEVRSLELTRDKVKYAQFFLLDQGKEDNGKSRDQRVSEFLTVICGAEKVEVATFPTEIHPEYYPHSKNTSLTINATELQKINSALELLSEPKKHTSAMYARC